MNPQDVKPGTRCECRNPDCPGSLRERTDGPREACRDEAVRMVTVPFDKGTHGYQLGEMREVPMCAACAEHHEKSAEKKVDRGTPQA